MRYDIELRDHSETSARCEGDFSFVAFSLAHAPCGDNMVEVRLGEHTLLEWCTACAVMEIFGLREA